MRSSDNATLFQGRAALVIDDSPLMRQLLRSLLRQFGFSEIGEAADGTEALQRVRSRRFDVAICDWMMEPTDGLEFLRALRQLPDAETGSLPLIMVTSVADEAKVLAIRDQGVTEYLVKPISAQKLESRLASALTRPRTLVKTDTYVGPDRRRRDYPSYSGPRRRLSDRVADLPWDEDDPGEALRIAKAEIPDYADILRMEVDKMRGLLAEVEAADQPPVSAWRRLLRTAHDIMGQAPSFEHHAAATVAASMDRLLKPVWTTPEILDVANTRRVRAVRTHVEALALLVEEGIRETSPETDMLVKRLRLAVDRVRREESGDRT